MTTTAIRYHDISVGHRVVGHESKCRHLHGHNYRIHFEVIGPKLDKVGRVIDFSVIKDKLCMWLEEEWDHKFLAFKDDKLMRDIYHTSALDKQDEQILLHSIVWTSFNPTAENMAKYLIEVIGPRQLEGTGCTLQKVTVEETRKCSASYTRNEK